MGEGGIGVTGVWLGKLDRMRVLAPSELVRLMVNLKSQQRPLRAGGTSEALMAAEQPVLGAEFGLASETVGVFRHRW